MRTAEGWLELGDWQSAVDELANISADFQSHVSVLKTRIRVYLRSNPALALELNEDLMRTLPNDSGCLIHRSFALKDLGRVQEALDLLLPSADLFPENWVIPYNLACYFCQLGRLDEACQMLTKSLAVNNSMSRQLRALSDPDLAPLWNQLAFRLPCKHARRDESGLACSLALN